MTFKHREENSSSEISSLMSPSSIEPSKKKIGARGFVLSIWWGEYRVHFSWQKGVNGHLLLEGFDRLKVEVVVVLLLGVAESEVVSVVLGFADAVLSLRGDELILEA